MPNRLSQIISSSKLQRRLLVVGLVIAGVWFALFDSHSLLRRVQYYSEYRALTAENAQLQAEIDDLEQRVSTRLSDEVVEEVAREQYGMRRDGETVYPVEGD